MFGGFEKKLRLWQEAGIIADDQIGQILAYEKERKSGKLGRDLTRVGFFAILLGLLSIIGANWQIIPDFAKLGLHALLNLGVVFAIFKFRPEEHPYKRDACVTILFGLFLTFIALIAQIYQLHGELHQTLLFWMAICTPFVWFFGRTGIAIVPWLAAFLVTFYMNLIEMFELEKFFEGVLALTGMYLPIILLGLAKFPPFQKLRPGFVSSFQRLGITLPAIIASIACSLFYSAFRVSDYHSYIVSGLGAGLILITLLFFPRGEKSRNDFDQWTYLTISGVLLFLPYLLIGVKSAPLAAITFIAYWVYMAWLGARIHAPNLTDWAIRIVMIRVFIVYLEVFGSMMTTGFGMILSGVLLILAIKYSSKFVAFGRKLVTHE